MSEELSSENGQPGPPRTVTELLERCNAAWAELNRLLDGLDAVRLSASDPQGWTVKDHLAHITAWERSLLAVLGGRDPLAALGLSPEQVTSRNVDRLNEGIYEVNRDRPIDDVLADFRATHDETMAALSILDTADLHRPYAHFQPDDPRKRQEPVLQWIAGDTYEHYEEHLPWLEAMLDKS